MKNAKSKTTLRIVLIIVIIFLLYAFLIEPNLIFVSEVNLSSDYGMEIVFFSDLHMNGYTGFHDRMLDKIKNLSPDVILFGGDAVTENTNYEDLEKFFANLSSIAQVYAVIGNWDYFTEKRILDIYDRANISLLNGTDAVVRGKSSYISIAGMPLNTEYSLLTSHKLILMGHYPHSLKRFSGTEPEIYLCGHTHAGQVYIPFITKLFYRNEINEIRGFFDYQGTKGFITSGIGSWFHLRFLTFPEIVLINL
ncbi:MAG: metallophosphoesterase family protein [Kosmotogaceae bacterium]